MGEGRRIEGESARECPKNDACMILQGRRPYVGSDPAAGPEAPDWSQRRVTMHQSAPDWSQRRVTMHQSAPNQHGHEAEHGTRRVWGAVELRSAREHWPKNDVEVIVHVEFGDLVTHAQLRGRQPVVGVLDAARAALVVGEVEKVPVVCAEDGAGGRCVVGGWWLGVHGGKGWAHELKTPAPGTKNECRPA